MAETETYTGGSGSYTPLRRLWRLLRPDKRDIVNVYVYAFFNGLIYLSLPLGIQAIVNFIQGGQVSASWMVLIGVVLMGVAATGVLQILQLRILENLQQRIFARAAFEFAIRLPRMRFEALYKQYAPELVNRFFDTIGVQKGLSKILIDFSTAALQAFFGLVLLSFYHSFFFAFGLALLALLGGIFWLTWRPGLRTSLAESKQKYKAAYWLQQIARSLTTFKMAGAESPALPHMDANVGVYLDARESHYSVLRTQYIMMVGFKVVVAAGLLIIGSLLVIDQQMNLGQFVAAEIIILLVMNSVEKLVVSLETVYDVLTSLEKIGSVTDLALEGEGGTLPPAGSPQGYSVSLRGVEFLYPGSSRPVLQAITMDAPAGARVGISGPNGGGKTSLLALCGGLYNPQSGIISIAGQPLAALDLALLRSRIGQTFSQEPFFAGTLRDNIAFGRTKIGDEQMLDAAEAVGLGPYIAELPLALGTMIDPDAGRLPRTIIGRLRLARAIVHQPKLLLLDGLPDNLSTEETEAIAGYLTDPARPWTLIAATDEPALLARCTQTFTLTEGELTPANTAHA